MSQCRAAASVFGEKCVRLIVLLVNAHDAHILSPCLIMIHISVPDLG